MNPRRILGALEGFRPGEVPPPQSPPASRPPAGGRTPYPDYDVMAPDKWSHDWDEKTRRVVLDRVLNVPDRVFFTELEFAILEAVCRRLLPQDDRAPEQRVPIAPFVDQRLATGKGNGYRYEDLPWDDEAYRLGLAGIDGTSRALFGGKAFAALTDEEQDTVLGSIEDGDPPGKQWQSLSASRFFKNLLHDVLNTYYAHPAAWNEIGFSGPASPRGHIRLSLGKRDPWEAGESRPLPPPARRRNKE